jgi:hypothetical protein
MKRLTTVLALATFALLLGLPRPAAADIQFGLKAGGNLANLSGADVDAVSDTLKTKVGFVGGVFLALNFGKVVTIQSEVLYTMKGASFEYTELDETYSGKLYGDYIEIPLLLKIRFPMPGIQPFVFAGPSVGFKLGEKITFEGETIELPEGESFFENNDYGAIFGAGLGLGRKLHLDVRYSLGLKKVIAMAEGETPLDVKTGVWSATLGFAF